MIDITPAGVCLILLDQAEKIGIYLAMEPNFVPKIHSEIHQRLPVSLGG